MVKFCSQLRMGHTAKYGWVVTGSATAPTY